MKSYIKEDFKRAILSTNTLIAVILCSVCIILNFTDIRKSFYWENRNAVTAFLLIFKGQYDILFFFFASLIASLPYAGSYAIDKKSGFIKDINYRMNKSKYFVVRYFVNGIVGGAILALSLLISLAVLLVLYRNNPINLPKGQYMLPGAFSYFYNHKPIVYPFICILMSFGYGFIFSTLGLSISVLTENVYLAVLFPLLFPVIITMIFGGSKIMHYTSVEILFFPSRFASSTPHQFFMVESIWLIFVTILYIVAARRKVLANE